MDWNDININTKLIEALKMQGIVSPTKVQEGVIGSIVEKKDLIVQSETGSGKTLAYLLPIFQIYEEVIRTNQVIILVPTHELAMQVYKQAELLASNAGVLLCAQVVMGDVNIERQILKLREKPQIIIGTSGRVLELIKRKKISAHTVKTIIIDEADKLLDKNNADATKAVIKCTMKDRQLLFFSASMPKNAVDTAKELSHDAVIIRTTSKEKIPSNIEHLYIVVDRRDKIETLRKLVHVMKTKRAMIFINKVSDIEEATQKLAFHGLKAECLHGSNLKADRKRVVEGFHKGDINYLVATDIAARGLHFERIDVVYHISIPEEPMDYLHRAGRTGRNGVRGVNVLIVTKEEVQLIKKYQKEFGINIVSKQMYEGKLVKGMKV